MAQCGIRWASAIGRGGAILAPDIIGVIVGLGLPLRQNFVVMAMPALLAVLLIDRKSVSQQGVSGTTRVSTLGGSSSSEHSATLA